MFSESRNKIKAGGKFQNCDLEESFGTGPKHWTGFGYSCNKDFQR